MQHDYVVRPPDGWASLGPEAPSIVRDGFAFRDLNRNGELDRYEDRRRSREERSDDLLARMTVKEKAGLTFHTVARPDPDDTFLEATGLFGEAGLAELVLERHVRPLQHICDALARGDGRVAQPAAEVD